MRAHIDHDHITKVIKIYLFEEGFNDTPTRILRILDEATLRWDMMEPGEQVNPTFMMPHDAAVEMAKAILGKTQLLSDDLLETLKVERARVDTLIEHIIAMDLRRSS